MRLTLFHKRTDGGVVGMKLVSPDSYSYVKVARGRKTARSKVERSACSGAKAVA